MGALFSGGLSDKFGRKRLLILAATLFTVTSIGTAMSHAFTTFVYWRLTGGVAIGMASSLSPMYIAEISPAKLRGMFVSVNQLTIAMGVTAAQLVNYLVARPVPLGATDLEIVNSWNGQVGWRWMFGLTAIPSFIFFVLMFVVPESPRWLVKNGKSRKAHKVLGAIGGESYADEALTDIEATLVNDVERVDFHELLDPKMAKILLLGVLLAVFQQWCGINSIFNYAEEIFGAAKYGLSDTLLNIFATGAVCLVFTFVAIFTVDRVGRRFLMLAGAGGLAFLYLILGDFYRGGVTGTPVLIVVLGAMACYACTLAPVTWVILSEIFPNRIRGAAMSTSVFALWVACFALTYAFPYMKSGLGIGNTFWLYGAICAVGFTYIFIRLPETKNKTLEDIERQLLN